MTAYFEYSQELEIGSTFEPVSGRSVLANLEGGITEENKIIARGLVNPVAVIDAKTLLDGLGEPYYVRIHFHDHANQQPCEVESL